MIKQIIILLTVAFPVFLTAQHVGIGTNTPNASALLDISSTNKGLLTPRLTTLQRENIADPANGLLVYDTDKISFWYYGDGAWNEIKTNQVNELWQIQNDSINHTSSKYTAVRTDIDNKPPGATLEVNGSLLIQSDIAFSKSNPTAAQTTTMTNNGFQNLAESDSVHRLFDPAGPNVNYANNQSGTITVFAPSFTGAGYKVHFNPADFGIAQGDTLWMSPYPFPECRDQYYYRFANTATAPADLFVSSNNTFFRFIFRSNGDGITASGFDITVTKLYSVSGQAKPVTAIGKSFFFDPEKGALHSGLYQAGEAGNSSLTIGYSLAPGNYAVAMGYSTASGNYSFSSGYATKATSLLSFAGGNSSSATGGNSFAYGDGALAEGTRSVALVSGRATGFGAVAAGEGATANGILSTALGMGTMANGLYSTTIGVFNDSIVPAENNLTPAPTDPLFIIGNGTTYNTRSNAMVVRYNGNTDISGYTRLGTVADNAPRIKIKEVQSINSATTQGGSVTTPHGLNRFSIIAMNVLLNYGNGDVTPGFRGTPGYEFSIAYDDVNIYVYNISGNSANILGKPLKISVTYKQ